MTRHSRRQSNDAPLLFLAIVVALVFSRIVDAIAGL